MPSRKSVMISSTARDLPYHREQVRLACERAGFAPHDMMEHLTALNADAIAASLAMVENAEVYVGVFAFRYGYVPDGHSISITEMEYDHAVALSKPHLIFFIHEDHPVTGKDVETGPGAVKLQALKDRIGKARVAAFFKSPEDLRAHVVESLNTFSKEAEKAGAKAAPVRALIELHRETSIPTPPEAYIAHPYTLLQTRELVGRRAELNLLTDWVIEPDAVTRNARILAVVAIGGMGKSAHAWKWFNQIAPNEMKPLAGRLWWSFYESDATFENFLNRALCYVNDQDEQELRRLPWQDREAMLLRRLDEKPYLLVLDGLERILIAYNRMDASMLADDQYDQQTANYVADAIGLPESAAQSFVGQHRLRQTTDPRAGAFLQKLAQVRSSRVLITTRLYPSELQLPTGGPYPNCAAHFLRGLSDDDALALWRGLGVSGSRNELLPIFKSVQNHPMLIQALASEVANYRKAPGDFAAWRADHPQFDPTSLSLVQSRTHILQFALRGLSKAHRDVLHTIVGFRMPASYATLEALLVGPDKLVGNIQMLDLALSALEDRGLIGWDREANRYDAHPIVRGIVWQLAGVQDRRDILTALDQHFEPIPTPDWLSVDSLADLTPAIERYHTLVDLGRFDDAYSLLNDRLINAAYFRLSAHRELIAWLEALIPEGKSSEPRLSLKWMQSKTLSTLALSYNITGQPGKGIGFLERAIKISSADGDDNALIVDWSNLGIAFGEIGRLADSSISLMKSLTASRDSEDIMQEMVSLREYGRNSFLAGRLRSAHIAINRSEKIVRILEREQSLGLIKAYMAEAILWTQDPVSAIVLSDEAWMLADATRIERDFIRAALQQGRASLGVGDLPRASERLHHALVRARGSNVVEFELPILVAIAQLELRQGDAAGAKSRLNETWEGIERGPYPIVRADALNVLAEAEIALGDREAALVAAANAYEAAWCDGPPFAYAYGLDKAGAQLAALGVRGPDLPSFDASKFAPWPEVEINPKDDYWVDPDNLIWE